MGVEEERVASVGRESFPLSFSRVSLSSPVSLSFCSSGERKVWGFELCVRVRECVRACARSVFLRGAWFFSALSSLLGRFFCLFFFFSLSLSPGSLCSLLLSGCLLVEVDEWKRKRENIIAGLGWFARRYYFLHFCLCPVVPFDWGRGHLSL